MKGVVLGIFLMSMAWSSTLVFALTTSLADRYAPDETMIARIEGVLGMPVQANQIELRRNHVLVPLEYGVGQLDTTTYFWGIAPHAAGNYSLVIKNVEALQEGVATKINYTHAFSVKGEVVPYAIRPGFVSTSEDITLSITSYRDTQQTISVSHPTPHDIVLSSGENTLVIPANSIPANTLIAVDIGRYRVPVYIYGNVSMRSVAAPSVWVVDPSSIRSSLRRNEPLPLYTITATYRGSKELKNVAIEHNASVITVSPSTFKKIAVNETIRFNVSIKASVTTLRNEQIRFGTGNETYIFSLIIEPPLRLENATNGTSPANGTSLPYCSQLSGIICRASDQCTKPPIASREGACCVATCEQAKEKSKAWIGYLIFGIIILIGAIVWVRYKKVAPKEALHPLGASLGKHP